MTNDVAVKKHLIIAKLAPGSEVYMDGERMEEGATPRLLNLWIDENDIGNRIDFVAK